MEFFIALIIITVLLYIIGVSVETLIVCGVILAGLIFLMIFVMFIYSFICLLTSKKTKMRFLRIDKAPFGKFSVAYYLLDGEEYPCAFPSEPFLRSRFYPSDRNSSVMLNRFTKRVYDKPATVTCIVGFIFSLALATGCVYIIFFY